MDVLRVPDLEEPFGRRLFDQVKIKIYEMGNHFVLRWKIYLIFRKTL